MLTPRAELVVTVTLMALILVGLYLTSRIDLAFSSDLETFSGPRAYPRLILIVLLALVAGVAATQMKGALTGPTERAAFDKRLLFPIALFCALLVFVTTFERLGYILTMVPLLTCVALLCGAHSVLRALLVSLCLTALCLVVFRYGLATVLPEGVFAIDAAF